MNVKQKLLACAGSTAVLAASSWTTAAPASATTIGPNQSVPIPAITVPASSGGNVTVVGNRIPIGSRTAQYLGGGTSAVTLIAQRTGESSTTTAGFTAGHGDLVVSKNSSAISCTEGDPVLQVDYVSYDASYTGELHVRIETNIPDLDSADGTPGDNLYDEVLFGATHPTEGGALTVFQVCLPAVG